MDRKFAYALFGVFLSAAALGMAVAARSEAMFIVFTLLYAFVQGFNYASFCAVVLEAIGRGAAATKYNLYASLSNMPTVEGQPDPGCERGPWGQRRPATVVIAGRCSGRGFSKSIAVLRGLSSGPFRTTRNFETGMASRDIVSFTDWLTAITRSAILIMRDSGS